MTFGRTGRRALLLHSIVCFPHNRRRCGAKKSTCKRLFNLLICTIRSPNCYKNLAVDVFCVLNRWWQNMGGVQTFDLENRKQTYSSSTVNSRNVVCIYYVWRNYDEAFFRWLLSAFWTAQNSMIMMRTAIDKNVDICGTYLHPRTMITACSRSGNGNPWQLWRTPREECNPRTVGLRCNALATQERTFRWQAQIC